MEFDEPKMKLLPHKSGRKIFAIACDFNFQLGLKIKLFHNILQENTDNKQRAKIWFPEFHPTKHIHAFFIKKIGR